MTGYFEAAPRALQPGDAEATRTVVRDAIGDTPYIGRVLELLDLAQRHDPECDALIIERDGTVAALALFGPVAGARDVWRLYTLHVPARLSLREFGGAILEATLASMRARAGRMVIAELPADPIYGDVLSLLRASDFDQDARIVDFYRDGVSLLILSRSL